MMSNSGTFEPLPKDLRSDNETVLLSSKELRAVNPQDDPQKHQLPILTIGEIVEIKMVKFRVVRIKRDGKLGLQMLSATRQAEGKI